MGILRLYMKELHIIVTSVTIQPSKREEKNRVRHKQYEHEVINNRPGKIVCSQRSIPFTSSWVHRFHLRSEHEGVTYDCDQCDYKATEQIHLV